MAFGSDQQSRLLRESWTADDLAQELYAMYNADIPVSTDSTVSINPPSTSTVAPIQITTPDSGQVLSATTPGGTTYDLSFNESTGQLQQSTDGAPPVPVGGGSGGGGGGPTIPVWG